LPRSSTGTATTAEPGGRRDGATGTPGKPYRGRFAPSPTGPLHFGSLLAAAGSWLDARAAGGEWLLRIEDIDPPREPAGAADEILRTLESAGLWWDGSVLRQSTRGTAYEAALETLCRDDWAYACTCSRKQIEAENARRGLAGARLYPGTCRRRVGRPPASSSFALRLRTTPTMIGFTDRLQGEFAQSLERETGDFIVRRREGYFAYQLAVTVDDAAQGITDVVRGIDLLDSTPRQLWLQRLLGFSEPRYLHLPVVAFPDGQKLSKQSGAEAVNPAGADELAWDVLACLGQRPPAGLRGAPAAELWAWGVSHWEPQQLNGVRSMPPP